MYDNQFTSRLHKYTPPPQALPTPGETPDAVGFTPPPEPDHFRLLNEHKRVAMMTPTCGTICVSPQTFTITPPRSASPSLSDADSECLDDGSDSAISFTGEECPDLCGGPKNSCRSWTPPASPFYYTDESGIFLLDDRQNYEERQKIELEHTLRDLDTRLQRLRETMSPPRSLSWLHDSENSTSVLHRGKSHKPSERFPRSPTEGLVEHSRFTTTSLKPCSYDCDGALRRCKLSPTQKPSSNSPQHFKNTQEKDEIEATDLGKLIHTSLEHVQSTNSPPRYLANVSEIEAQPLPREPIATTNPHEELSYEALSMRHASPQIHFGNTAYPTPLPSSPESKPSRKRGRVEGFDESSGCKRRREEADERVPMLWRLRNK
ncbi:MAG: hypothetical protein ALECFALPRED_002830 [Alectoria fallacina]|uniref:Uncharacterized protein n=1 Tax=Alectoria fallacina TaxID=1903189 RepID=A0A8H3IMS7_9LECA|nr:MAG: hypothetical protein ALECFALPRED_002830 [Alectoria fallacina]